MLNVIENINLAVPLAGGGIGTDVTGGLSLRWTYGGITGSKWTDLSGNGNHGYKSGSGTLSDSGSQLGYKFDGSLWFEVPTTLADAGANYYNASISSFPGGTGATIIYYATLNSTSDQYLWNRSNVSSSGNAGWGHVINLESTQSSNRAPQDASAAFDGNTNSTIGYKYSISQLVDNLDPGYVVNTPNFKGGWSWFPSTSSNDITLASSSFEAGLPVFIVFRDNYVTNQGRYPAGGVSVQTSGSAQFDINKRPPNENVNITYANDTQTAVPAIGNQAGNKYLFSRNNYNKGGVAPVNFVMGKSAYYVSASVGGFTGTLLETRLYNRELSDSEVYRVCNAIRQNLQVSGSF